MKLSIIGAGNVGANVAQYVLDKGFKEIVLLDIVEGLAKGKALDLSESTPLSMSSTKIYGGTSPELLSNSDIVVVTAGLTRKPGMTRDELLLANAKIVSEWAEYVKRFAEEAIAIVVTNPLDAMSYLFAKKSGLPEKRVLGMAGVLDSARLRYFISEALKISPFDVSAMVLGGHGDEMVPLTRYATVSGIPLSNLLTKKEIKQIIAKTRNAGAEVIAHLKTTSAFYSPAKAVSEMVISVKNDERRVLPASAYLNGEYGFKNIYLGVPVILGSNGVERIIEIKLSEEERRALKRSAEKVKNLIKELRI